MYEEGWENQQRLRRHEKIKDFFKDAWTPEQQEAMEKQLHLYYQKLGEVAKLRDKNEEIKYHLQKLESFPQKPTPPGSLQFLDRSLTKIREAEPGISIPVVDFYFLHAAAQEAWQAFPEDEGLFDVADIIEQKYNAQLRRWKEAREKDGPPPSDPQPLEITPEFQTNFLRIPELLITQAAEQHKKIIAERSAKLLELNQQLEEIQSQLVQEITNLNQDSEPLRASLSNFQELLYKKFRDPTTIRYGRAEFNPDPGAEEATRFADWKWDEVSHILLGFQDLEAKLGNASHGNHYDAFLPTKSGPKYMQQWHEVLSPLLALAVAQPNNKVQLIHGDLSGDRHTNLKEAQRGATEQLKNYGPAWVISSEGLIEFPSQKT